MTSIDLPLQIVPKGMKREELLKNSIDSAIHLIMTTARFSTPIDPQFGFVFNNLRFEMFNENEGVVFNSGDTDTMDGIQGLYEKKISGSSKSINTFAAELKDAVIKYEQRLDNVSVSMTYIREERLIYVTVKGVIIKTKEDYTYQTKFRVWN
jgi:hypothetical protein